MDAKELQQVIQLIQVLQPRPSQVNLKQAAEMLSVSEPTARKLLRSGVINLNKSGLISVAEIDAVLIQKAA